MENPRIHYVFSTSSEGNTSIPAFPQMEKGVKSVMTIGEHRFLNIFTLSTTTKVFK